eukprot:1944597-Prymnesium_polylepis.1
MPPRVCLRDAPEACAAVFCTRRDCDAMPPHTFQVPLARPTHSRAVRRLTIHPGESGNVQRERTRAKRSIPPTITRTPHHQR